MAEEGLGEEGMPGEGRKMECQAMGEGAGKEAWLTRSRPRGAVQQLPAGASGSGLG